MQNRIETPENSHWHSPLLNDISFIKKHLRYPINKKTIWLLLWIIGMAAFTIIIISILMILNYGNLNEKIVEKSNVLAFLSMGAVLLVLTLAIYRRIQSFKFISIDSNFTVNDNIALIRQFLQNQNIAFYHNPRAVEVFQISSRILDVQYGQREIMVFIADENRILINSHFTSLVGDRGLKEISSSGHKIMAKELRKWLLNQENNRTTQFNLKKMGT